LKYLASFPVTDVRDRISEAENGTLQWILSEPKIDRWWNSEHSSLLWINGSPGQGKSVLCKHILEKLERVVGDKRKASSHKIIYFFCSGQLHPQFQNAETILRTLIVQLLSTPHLFAHLPGQYQKRAERFETAPLARLWAIFRDMISDEYHDRIYCLLDALDEFESGITDLLERIQRLFSSVPVTKRPSIKFLVTSRQKKNITRSLANAEALSLKAHCDDIQRFIHAKLESLSSPLSRLKPLIKQGLAANAGSTFLWVSIVIKRIKRLELPNKKKVMREIEDSPPELDELYQKLSRELFRDEDTIRLLTWAIYAREPLSLKELETALAVRSEENCWHIQDTEEYRTHLTERAVHDHAGLLLEVIDGKVYLIHQSVKDFFTKADSPLAASDFFHKEKPDSVLARACIRYLDFEDFESAQLLDRIRREYDERSEAMSQYPLLEYASRHWYSHVLSDEDASLLYSDFNGIIYPENIRAQLWFTIASGRRTRYTTRSSIAIELDIGWLARLILRDGEGAPEEHFPVHCLTMLAANRGQVLEALLDHGEPYLSGITEEVVKVAAENSNGKRVMMLLLDRQGDKIQITEEVVKAAALNSDESIMTLLLDRRGCDIQITDEVVQAAAWNSNGEVMAILLDRRGDDVQITEEVVKAAAGNWNGKRVMEVLLDRRGDDIQITEEVVGAAAQNYNGEVMAVLLNRRGDSIPMSKELTASIAWRFDAGVMALLLDRRGSDVEITEEVVKLAMGNRNGGEVMALLLDRRGNDIQITEEIAKRAAKYHNSETITLLLNRRGDEIPITEELTKLIAGRSDVETMTLLLDQRGDDVQITEGVMEAAAGNPNGEDVMTLLRDRQGADILVTEGVVRAAAGNPNGRAFMAWLLDQRGDDVQVTEEVLIEAAQNSNEEIMELLLDRRGDDIKISEEVVKAAAKNWGGKKVMALLLDRRDDVQVTEGVVEAAAQNYNGEVMALLLDQRGDDIQITEELTALIARKFSVETMTLLLDQRGSNIHITEEIVKAATQNHNGQEIIALLLDRRGDDVQITEEVMKTVAESWNGQKVMALLLDRRRDYNITEGVVKAAASNRNVAFITLLLDRLGSDIHITEEVIKAAAGNSNEGILMALLNRDDIQITEEVVKVAARNRNGKVMMLLLDRRGDEIQITEEVIKAAVAGNQNDKVMMLLLNRRDDVRTTDELIKAAAAVG
jgi:NACHT domain